MKEETIYQAAIRAYFDNAMKAVMRDESSPLPSPYDMLRNEQEVYEFNQQLEKQKQEWMMQNDSDEREGYDGC